MPKGHQSPVPNSSNCLCNSPWLSSNVCQLGLGLPVKVMLSYLFCLSQRTPTPTDIQLLVRPRLLKELQMEGLATFYYLQTSKRTSKPP